MIFALSAKVEKRADSMLTLPNPAMHDQCAPRRIRRCGYPNPNADSRWAPRRLRGPAAARWPGGGFVQASIRLAVLQGTSFCLIGHSPLCFLLIGAGCVRNLRGRRSPPRGSRDQRGLQLLGHWDIAASMSTSSYFNRSRLSNDRMQPLAPGPRCCRVCWS